MRERDIFTQRHTHIYIYKASYIWVSSKNLIQPTAFLPAPHYLYSLERSRGSGGSFHFTSLGSTSQLAHH